MFCRAKICLSLIAASAIQASAASLDVREKSTPVSTDQPMPVRVFKPSEAKAKFGTGTRVKVQKIKPVAQSPGKVEVNGFIFNRPADATSPSIVQEAVAPRKK